MKIDLTHNAKVIKGRLELGDRARFIEHFQTFEGLEVEVVLRRRRKQRTSSQNRVQWWYFRAIGDAVGWEAEDIHRYVCCTLIAEPPDSRGLRKPGRTSGLTTVEHNDLLERVRRWAAMGLPNESGDPMVDSINLPEPNEVPL